MREKHHGTQPLFVLSQFAECLAKDLKQFLQGGKNPIVQVFLSQFLPQMFDRVDFRAIGGLKDQANIRLPSADLWPGASPLDRLA
jgi:hypothetical protein